MGSAGAEAVAAFDASFWSSGSVGARCPPDLLELLCTVPTSGIGLWSYSNNGDLVTLSTFGAQNSAARVRCGARTITSSLTSPLPVVGTGSLSGAPRATASWELGLRAPRVSFPVGARVATRSVASALSRATRSTARCSTLLREGSNPSTLDDLIHSSRSGVCRRRSCVARDGRGRRRVARPSFLDDLSNEGWFETSAQESRCQFGQSDRGTRSALTALFVSHPSFRV